MEHIHLIRRCEFNICFGMNDSRSHPQGHLAIFGLKVKHHLLVRYKILDYMFTSVVETRHCKYFFQIYSVVLWHCFFT